MITREKKLYYNTFSTLILQLVFLICGFILPKQTLLYYGSEVNGLVVSITRFLSVISLLEMGMGPIIQFNLYKPLSDKDNETISKIIISAERFYKKLATIFLIYIIILVYMYPKINKEFNFYFTSSMIIIISMSIFAQYYFGLTYQAFLNADQKIYINSILQIFTMVLNLVVSIILMKLGCSIHIVKFISAIVFLFRPLFQNIYVKRKYKLNLKIKFEEEPIKQKWNGFAQHIAAVVTGELDVILLTFFIGYQSVSIYSSYFLVISGITNFVLAIVAGLESYWGNIIANNEKKILVESFKKIEFLTHFFVTFLYTTTAILIAPFISVYIKGIKDENLYYLPLFGALATLAYAIRCLRVPYFSIISSAGHYKETQNGAFISMIINIIISILLIFKYNLVGIVIGTFLAMLYHTIYFVLYLEKNILFYKLKIFLIYLVTDSMIVIFTFYFSKYFFMKEVSYISWIVYAIKISSICLTFTCLVFIIFHYKYVKILILNLKRS